MLFLNVIAGSAAGVEAITALAAVEEVLDVFLRSSIPFSFVQLTGNKLASTAHEKRANHNDNCFIVLLFKMFEINNNKIVLLHYFLLTVFDMILKFLYDYLLFSYCTVR